MLCNCSFQVVNKSVVNWNEKCQLHSQEKPNCTKKQEFDFFGLMKRPLGWARALLANIQLGLKGFGSVKPICPVLRFHVNQHFGLNKDKSAASFCHQALACVLQLLIGEKSPNSLTQQLLKSKISTV